MGNEDGDRVVIGNSLKVVVGVLPSEEVMAPYVQLCVWELLFSLVEVTRITEYYNVGGWGFVGVGAKCGIGRSVLRGFLFVAVMLLNTNRKALGGKPLSYSDYSGFGSPKRLSA
jgi:hypothetical protein